MPRLLFHRVFIAIATAAALFLAADQPAPAADGVDTSPLLLQTVRAFPKFKPRRPVAITHAGDGTNRLFIVSEYGQILVIPNDQGVTEAKTFLDIEDKVDYQDKENEEGLLGLAFHPKYQQNGEFFVHYTAKEPPHMAVISRFKVSKNDPNQADPKSEEVLLKYQHPYWNHKGGNLLFGPDGYLYIVFGDGGSANDPHGNGQNLKTLLGKILRIDIDKKGEGKPYAIPPRFLPTDCGTCGACRSTHKQSCSTRPTSGRTSGKRSTSFKRAATMVGTSARASTSST
jgi:glucose/arabinose dehydrogenase